MKCLFERKLNPWWKEGERPDYRFSLANERTFLAWIRTSLALLASAIALDQLILHYNLPLKWSILALSLAMMGAVISIFSWLRWRDNEIAMRHSRPLKLMNGMPILSIYISIASVLIIFYIL
ncbi:MULTISPECIES: YidH family protein [Edwardsiella]|uniref:DUF202 domain-containing protein n=2 Tax=Edwardsiella anguillarum TaxID=1821960 RepID=A0ABY8SI39_9GAMM|nr:MULTISPECIES: DUF202 domain-containing protein [Edwardsiella]AKM48118.1 hypothetical protein QY76_13000 [Edwardsiella sp. EA181011]GAJ68288.1 inner membrane protein [Edwardsiella piscicida]AIJ09800.1 Putative inner membrane protein [Edwardsiella anguillarum ET080813]AKR77494.1 DUF202 domain-containing protein [Edwardsiella sp. LADL05-105]KAB0592729.1 DUF202 domain-containing protein [Edwardsiella anguillarum]